MLASKEIISADIKKLTNEKAEEAARELIRQFNEYITYLREKLNILKLSKNITDVDLELIDNLDVILQEMACMADGVCDVWSTRRIISNDQIKIFGLFCHVLENVKDTFDDPDKYRIFEENILNTSMPSRVYLESTLKKGNVLGGLSGLIFFLSLALLACSWLLFPIVGPVLGLMVIPLVIGLAVAPAGLYVSGRLERESGILKGEASYFASTDKLKSGLFGFFKAQAKKHEGRLDYPNPLPGYIQPRLDK